MGNVGVKKKKKKLSVKKCRCNSYLICPRFTHHDAPIVLFF